MFEVARKPHDQNASSYGISYENTLLVKHKDDAAPFTHWHKINDRARDELRFQSHFLHNEEAIKSNAPHHSIFERARQKTTWKWSKWRVKERFDLISRDKNRHCESIDNRSQRGLKNGLQIGMYRDRTSRSRSVSVSVSLGSRSVSVSISLDLGLGRSVSVSVCLGLVTMSTRLEFEWLQYYIFYRLLGLFHHEKKNLNRSKQFRL